MTDIKFEAKQKSGVALAYLGDAAAEVLVREKLLLCGISDTARFNELSQYYVTAKAQSGAARVIEPFLTEEESDIYKRGRNASITHHPKNQKLSDYRRATGFEALMGYLYLIKDENRMRELFEKAYSEVNEKLVCGLL